MIGFEKSCPGWAAQHGTEVSCWAFSCLQNVCRDAIQPGHSFYGRNYCRKLPEATYALNSPLGNKNHTREREAFGPNSASGDDEANFEPFSIVSSCGHNGAQKEIRT